MVENDSKLFLLTVKEVADILRVSPSTIYSAVARGDVPCVRLWRGKRKTFLRFRRADIDALINRSESTPHSMGSFTKR